MRRAFVAVLADEPQDPGCLLGGIVRQADRPGPDLANGGGHQVVAMPGRGVAIRRVKASAPSCVALPVNFLQRPLGDSRAAVSLPSAWTSEALPAARARSRKSVVSTNVHG